MNIPCFKKNMAAGDAGFTLLEIIICMVILGIMVAVAGMGIVTGMKGFLFTRENTHMAQKAQLTMTRLGRELLEITSIDANATTSSSIAYERPGGQFGVARVGDTIKLRQGAVLLPDEDTGDILIDGVGAFTLRYYKDDGNGDGFADTWNPGSDSLDRLAAIEIVLTLSRTESEIGSTTFSTTVSPRNNKNYGGAPPTMTPPARTSYACFVATAAYGRPDHPAVVLLKRFRDTFLAPWAAGRILIKAYNSAGPFLADAIRDSNWACLAARVLLAPFVGGAFMLLHVPAMIPVMLVLSWLSGILLVSFLKKRRPAKKRYLPDTGGSILIALIITMVVLSSIGGAMLSMTSTSSLSRVKSNSAEKAYLLAESGFRYAASRYLNAGSEDARDSVLGSLHGDTFTLLDNNGIFEIEVYPYFFKTETPASVTPTTSLKTYMPGGFPPDLDLPSLSKGDASGGRLKIGTEYYDYWTYARSGTSITFDLTTPVVPFDGGEDVYSAARSLSSAQTVNEGGSLYLSQLTNFKDNIKAFPEKNGTVIINGHVYAYEKADYANRSLTGITDPENPSMPALSVDPGTDIVLQKFAQIHSTGIFGEGDLETRRKVVYHTPLPTSTAGEKVEFHDTFDTDEHWDKAPEETLGTHSIETIGGDSALKVTGTEAVPGTAGDVVSLRTLDWSTTNVNLANAHRTAGYFLNYDTQVKIGFDPEPAPELYMAGLSFRKEQGRFGDSYGLSFVRGDNSGSDGIPDEFVPHSNWPMIVLWQQTGSALNRNWLAYSYLAGPEIPWVQNWTPDWPWSPFGTVCHSGGTCWFCDTSASWIQSYLVSNPIDISGIRPAVLSFWHWYDLNNADGRVEISVDWGPWTTTNPLDANEGRFTGSLGGTSALPVELDIRGRIPASGASTMRVRFRYRTFNFPYGAGWHVDDVQINGAFPMQDATLMVRIKEGVSIRFSSGSGPAPILDGDTVIGVSSGARGVVNGDPMLDAGTSWSAGNAAGTLLLNNLSGEFTPGEQIKRVASATFAMSDVIRARDNYIRAYYGDTAGFGTPDDTPLDYEKHGNPRGTVNWPPDEADDTVPANDFFTLVQWDEINADDFTADQLFLTGTGKEANAVIRSNTLTTPDSWLGSRPEIGLHTYGTSSTSVYFDDFALQAVVSAILTTPPIQE